RAAAETERRGAGARRRRERHGRRRSRRRGPRRRANGHEEGRDVSARVVVVGCGFPQLSLIRTAKRLGLFVVGADANPKAIGVARCDAFFEVSTNDVDALCAVVKESRATAITTSGSEVALKSTAEVAHRSGLPFHADPETIRRCQDKDEM